MSAPGAMNDTRFAAHPDVGCLCHVFVLREDPSCERVAVYLSPDGPVGTVALHFTAEHARNLARALTDAADAVPAS